MSRSLVLCGLAALWLAGTGCGGGEERGPGGGTGSVNPTAGAGGTAATGGVGGTGTVNPTAGMGAGTSGGGTGGIGGAAGVGAPGGAGGTSSTRVFDPRGDNSTLAAGSLCDRLSTIQCAGEDYCCSNPGRDFATCKQVMQQGCDEELLFDAIAAKPKSGFDVEHARLAFGEIQRRASLCDPTVAEFGDMVDGLRGMFKGTIAPDASCFTLNASFRDEAAAALASCLDPANNHCLPESTLRWVCRAHADAGGECFTDVNCKPGLYCDNPSFPDIGDGVCAARKANGETCSLPNECASLFCKGNVCVEATVDVAYCLAQ